MNADELAEALASVHNESFGWALSLTDWNEAQAEDVLQTAYVRVLSGKATFGGRSAFKTWLFGVIRRVSQEEGRKKGRDRTRHVDLDLVGEAVGSESAPVDALIRSEQSGRLIAAMNELPDRQREILHLVFYEDLSISQAAEVMGVSVGSARTHYDRGKKRLRSLLGEQKE